MRLLFVYFVIEDAGSAQDIRNYVRVGRELGHEVAVYGPKTGNSAFNFTQDVDSADAVIFVFEWTQDLRDGDWLDLSRLIGRVPRERRIVVDCDGALNERLEIEGDYNHRTTVESRRWIETCESLSDKLFQPSYHPLRPNVGTFFFHAYDPGWERDLTMADKEFGMIYVGHSKFRWRPMDRFLRAIEASGISDRRLGIIGHGWDRLPSWAEDMNMVDAYYTEPELMGRLGVEIIDPIPSHEVIGWMSRAMFNPVIYRPLFSHLQFVTCRTFETFGAATIPLLGLEPDYVTEIYGEEAGELVLPAEGAEDKIADIFERPEHYAATAARVREYLAARHSYRNRIEELVELVNC